MVGGILRYETLMPSSGTPMSTSASRNLPMMYWGVNGLFKPHAVSEIGTHGPLHDMGIQSRPPMFHTFAHSWILAMACMHGKWAIGGGYYGWRRLWLTRYIVDISPAPLIGQIRIP